MKLAKLSLAAIMAVGAFTYASATPLTDAIKGVDLSGSARYRFNDAKNSEASNDFRLRVQLTTPVQENVSLVVRGTADQSNPTNGNSSTAGTMSTDRMFLNYTGLTNTTISAGRQYLGSPLDDLAATGVKVVYSSSGLSVAGVYYSESSLNTQAVSALGVAYANDMFGAKAWYINLAKEAATNSLNAYFLEGNGKAGPANIVVQYASKKTKGAAIKDTTLRVQVSAAVSNVGLKLGYINSGKNGGDTSLDGSAHGDNSLVGAGWATEANAADTDYVYGGVSTSVGKVGFAVDYYSASLPSTATASANKSELTGKISYALSNKVATYVKYSNITHKTDSSSNKFRFEVNYSF